MVAKQKRKPKRKMDKPVPVPPKKLATVPVLEANQVKTRMQELMEMASHVEMINHPEQEVDLEFLTKENLKINPAELPVLLQLIRDVKQMDSTVPDLEEIPHCTTMNLINATFDMDQTSEANPIELVSDEKVDPNKFVSSDTTKSKLILENKVDESSPSTKRKKVLVASSPNSPVIKAKKPTRAVNSQELPTGNYLFPYFIFSLTVRILAGFSGLSDKPFTSFGTMAISPMQSTSMRSFGQWREPDKVPDNSHLIRVSEIETPGRGKNLCFSTEKFT